MRFGLIGYGEIAQFYIHAFSKNKNASLIAIADTNTALREEIELKGFQYYEDYRKIIPEVDAVIVATPNYLHAEQSIYSLKAGKHVLCEKPMATNVADAEEMVKTAKQCNKVLMIEFHHRYNNQVQNALLKKRKVTGFEATNFENHYGDKNRGEYWYYSKKKCGGGVIIDNGTNSVDVLYEFVGPLKVLKADLYYKDYDVEQRAEIHFTFKGGKGIMKNDWDSNTEENKFIFHSTKDFEVDILKEDIKSEKNTSMLHEYENILAQFLISVEKMDDFGDRGLEIQKIIDEIYKNGKVIKK